MKKSKENRRNFGKQWIKLFFIHFQKINRKTPIQHWHKGKNVYFPNKLEFTNKLEFCKCSITIGKYIRLQKYMDRRTIRHRMCLQIWSSKGTICFTFNFYMYSMGIKIDLSLFKNNSRIGCFKNPYILQAGWWAYTYWITYIRGFDITYLSFQKPESTLINLDRTFKNWSL